MSRLTINTNIPALNAQRRFSNSTQELSNSFQRLSSGLRINRASDDASGLAVSSLLQADARIYNQGIRNLNDGVSYLNVAEGAIRELSNIVVRIRELAEQGANGTIGDSQRQALQEEVNALQSEYNRIIRSTEFNNNNLLTGLGTNTILQGGFGERGSLEIQVGKSSLGIENDPTRAGETIRVSTSSSGGEGNGNSIHSRISGDGRFVVFISAANNLVDGDTNGANDIFRKDLLTGETIMVSINSNGVQGNGSSIDPDISADGRYVVFHSAANTFVDGITNATFDVFRKDLLTGEIVRVSTSSSGGEANGASRYARISADGRYVVFQSEADNLVEGDTNGVADFFRKDMVTGEIIRVTTASDGTQANALSERAVISADGRYVAFESFASNLVENDTNGVRDIFRKDLLTGETIRINTTVNGDQISSQSARPDISADGRFIIFYTSSPDLVEGVTNGTWDVYRKDVLTGEVLRVSTNSNNEEANGPSQKSFISADGRYVVFETLATNLVDGDTNGTFDVYRKDLDTGETIRVSTSSFGEEATLLSSVNAVSADGQFVLFHSPGVFGSEITNGYYDIFMRDMSVMGVQEISGMIVSNQASARVTLDLAKRYEEELGMYQAGIGAGLSRADTFISNLRTSAENFTAASSQITDVDIADESSKLVKTQIMQQSAAAVLAQANLQPQLVLGLLRDV